MNERIKNLLELSWPASFSYDHHAGMFLSGEKQIAPEELPLGHGDLAAEVTEDGTVTSLPDVPLVQTVLGAVMLPKMYDWLDDNMTEGLANETVRVMRDVFVRMASDRRIIMDRDKGGFRGFDLQRLRKKHPHIVLITVGDCACLGVDAVGTFGERVWDEKIAGLSFHNIDTPPQAVSLYAGLGHLAHLAA